MRRMYRGYAALGVAMGFCVPAVAQAATASQSFSTAGEHAFTVPAGVSSLDVVLVGGRGGDGPDFGELGGLGATLSGTVAVSPGQVLYAEVGGDGNGGNAFSNAGFGGANGGGPGGQKVFLFGAPSGGGGGGASDLRTVPACPTATPSCATATTSLSSRLLVAGGGGGAAGGFFATNTSYGGSGGAADQDGSPGEADGFSDSGGIPGLRGTTSGGGDAGVGTNAAAGALGVGGGGGDGSLGGGGGGGGGGIYGGGGGAGGKGRTVVSGPNTFYYGPGGAGGGGGASTVPPGPSGTSGVTLFPTAAGAEPRVTITWTLPTPTVQTLAAGGVGGTNATLRGTVNPNGAPVSDCHFTISPAPPAGGSLPCAPAVSGAGTTPVSVATPVSGLQPGVSYTVNLSATNAQGQASGTPVTFRTLGTLPPPPRISKLTVTISRRHGRRAGTVSLSVSEPVSLLFGLERKKGKRWVTLHRSFAGRAKVGVTSIGFSVSGLTPGRYRLSALAVNAAGERSAPQQTTFSIRR